MPHSTVTPETVFRARPASPEDSVFSFGEPAPRLSEQEQYKRLIDAEAARQGLALAHLADRIGVARPRLHKVIRKKVMLRDDLRDQLFCVAFLHDHTAYDDPEVFLICEAMKGFYCEILTRRRGEIQVTLRPPIIHEALGRAYDMLLSHQERVMEHDRTLQA